MIEAEVAPAPRGLSPRVRSGLGWSTAGRFAALPAGAAANILVARALPPTDVGAYFVIVNLVSILALVSMLGLNQAVVRAVSEAMTRGRPAAAGAVVRTSLRITAVVSIAFGIVYLLAGHTIGQRVFGSSAIAGATAWIAVFIPVTALRLLVPEAFRGFSDIKWATILGDAATNVTLAVALATIVVGGWQTNLTEVLVVSVALSAALVVLSVGKLRAKLRPLGIAPGDARALLWIALPLLATNLSWNLMVQIDTILLGAFRSSADVAYYVAGARLASLLLVPLLIGMSFSRSSDHGTLDPAAVSRPRATAASDFGSNRPRLGRRPRRPHPARPLGAHLPVRRLLQPRQHCPRRARSKQLPDLDGRLLRPRVDDGWRTDGGDVHHHIRRSRDNRRHRRGRGHRRGAWSVARDCLRSDSSERTHPRRRPNQARDLGLSLPSGSAGSCHVLARLDQTTRPMSAQGNSAREPLRTYLDSLASRHAPAAGGSLPYRLARRLLPPSRRGTVAVALTEAKRPRERRRAEKAANGGNLRLHLGSAWQPKDGWFNVDLAGHPVDLAWNLAHGLPFPDGSAEAIFHEHLLEHLTLEAAAKLIEESHRVLGPGGVMRIAVPDAGRYLLSYADGGQGLIDEYRPGRPTNLLAGQEISIFTGIAAPGTSRRSNSSYRLPASSNAKSADSAVAASSPALTAPTASRSRSMSRP